MSARFAEGRRRLASAQRAGGVGPVSFFQMGRTVWRVWVRPGRVRPCAKSSDFFRPGVGSRSGRKCV